jgi:hypothetical protein
VRKSPAHAAISQLAGNATTSKDRAPFDALLALLRAANGDYARLQKQIATWFDAYIDRVGGEYKRRSQIVLAVIAIFVVGILNIDSFKVFKQLSSQPAIATALANRGEPLLRDRNAAPAGTSVRSKINQVKAQIAAIPVPIGWHLGPSQDDRLIPPWQKFFSLLITAIAASLGAPFWFATSASCKSALNWRQNRPSHPALWELERSTDYELQYATASLEGNPSSPHSHTAACARVIAFDGHGICLPARLFTASRSL